MTLTVLDRLREDVRLCRQAWLDARPGHEEDAAWHEWKAAEARLRAYLASAKEPSDEEIVTAFDRPLTAVLIGVRESMAHPGSMIALAGAVAVTLTVVAVAAMVVR